MPFPEHRAVRPKSVFDLCEPVPSSAASTRLMRVGITNTLLIEDRVGHRRSEQVSRVWDDRAAHHFGPLLSLRLGQRHTM
jgi:hypothetical protein